MATEIDPGHAVALETLALPGGSISLGVGAGLVSFAAIVQTPRAASSSASTSVIPTRSARPGFTSACHGARRLVTSRSFLRRSSGRGLDRGTALRGAHDWRAAGRGHAALDRFRGSRGSGCGRVIDLRYVLTPERRARIRPRQVTDAAPPPRSRRLKARRGAGGVGRLLALQIAGARVPVPRSGRRALSGHTTGHRGGGRSQALETAINAAVPGGARADEYGWTSPRGVARRCRCARTTAVRGVVVRELAIGLEADARRDRSRTALSSPLPPRSSRLCSRRSGSRSPFGPTCGTTAASSTTSRPRGGAVAAAPRDPCSRPWRSPSQGSSPVPRPGAARAPGDADGDGHGARRHPGAAARGRSRPGRRRRRRPAATSRLPCFSSAPRHGRRSARARGPLAREEDDGACARRA